MFSLAVCIYEMLTGNRVFQRDSAAASLAAVLEHEVDPDPRIEPRIWVALSRALAKRPYERQANCAELADSLRAAIDATDEELTASLQELRPRHAVTDASTPSSSANTPPRKKRDRKGGLPWTIAAAAAAALVAAIGTFAATRAGGAAHADEGKTTTPPASATSVTAISIASNTVPGIASNVPPTPKSAAVPSGETIELGDVSTPLTNGAGTPTPVVRHGAGTSTVGTSAPVNMSGGTHRPPNKPPPPPPPSSGKGPAKPVATAPGF
jgi:hypothetical protein